MNTTPRPTSFACPVPGCTHSLTGTASPFSSKIALLHHLNTTSHRATHYLTDFSSCAASGIFHCCRSTCPSSPKTFFPSLRSLTIHNNTHHPPPHVPPPATHPFTSPVDTPLHNDHSPQLHIATSTLYTSSPRQTTNHWPHGISFISTAYDHEPPDFRTTWRHFLKGRNKASFITLQSAIVRAIASSYNSPPTTNTTSAPFWWLLLHLDMLITDHRHNRPRKHPTRQQALHAASPRQTTSRPFAAHTPSRLHTPW